MSNLYYVLVENGRILWGPMSFKEAVNHRETDFQPAVILKLVVDSDGREVK